MPTARLDDIASGNVAHLDDIVGHDQPSADQPSDISNFVKGAASKLNPINMVSGAIDSAKAAYEHPIDSALAVLAHPYQALSRAKDALKAGNYEEAAAHVASALDPTGFATEDSAVKTATPGQRAEGLGELMGTGLSAYLGEKLPELAKIHGPEAARAIAAKLPETTPVQRELIGLVSPRAKNALSLANRVKDAMDTANTAPKRIPEPPSALSNAATVQPKVPTFQDLPEASAPIAEQAPAASAAQPPSVTPRTPQFQDLPEVPQRPVAVPVVAPTAAPPDLDLLNQISQKLTKGKQGYASLDASSKAIVDRFAASVKPVTQAAAEPQPIFQEAAQAAANPTPVLPPTPTALQVEPGSPGTNLNPKARAAAQALAKEMTGQEGPVTIKPGENGTPADDNPPSSAYEEAARARKASRMADVFIEQGFTPDEIRRIDPKAISAEDWRSLLGRDEVTGEQHHAPGSSQSADTTGKTTLNQAAEEMELRAARPAQEIERRAAQQKGATDLAARHAKAEAAKRAFTRELGWETPPATVGAMMK